MGGQQVHSAPLEIYPSLERRVRDRRGAHSLGSAMFWGSSNRKSYNSSDFDNDGSDAEDPDSRWSRSSRGRKRRDYDRKRHIPASRPWFGGLFNFSGESKSSKKKSCKKKVEGKGGYEVLASADITRMGFGMLVLSKVHFTFITVWPYEVPRNSKPF